ncbi:sugar ABC transporter ATP-binding protein [Nonomuraea monospora]|uniref:Sugar ABC transporter ATP-binding protein n=2 Tax=Nonomuraea monospora TaxID=568818 RepID=A0ABN3D3S9_9ACTN
MAILEMTGIRKSFASGEVLHGVDLTVEHGEIHALIGHNGAGKSTLMKILGGVHPDHEGTIAIDGEPVSVRTPKEAIEHGIAVIYQDFSLVPQLTVAENIALGREPRLGAAALVDHRELAARSAREAARVGIDLPMDQPVGRLGVAGQQLTEIVRALAQEPRILVMDEPTARLAPGERERLFAIMRDLAERGVGIVYISHFLDEITSVADRITVLRDGDVVARLEAGETDADGLARLLVGDDAADHRRAAAATPSAGGVMSPAAPPAEGATSPATPAPDGVTSPATPAPDGATSPATPAAGGVASRAGAGTPGLEVTDLVVAGRPPVSLRVAPGEIVGIAGLVGSGRSRLAKAIVGAAPSTGTVAVAGRALRRRTPARAARAGVLLIPEDRKTQGLVMTGTVQDNIELTALGGALTRAGLVRRAARRRLVADAVKRFQVRPADSGRIVDTLSGGNAQKVLLARAASAGPKVLLLDQPTAGVDVGAKAEIARQIERLARDGVAVVLISDDLDELLALTSRLLVMHTGAVTTTLNTADVDRPGLLSAISRVRKEAA